MARIAPITASWRGRSARRATTDRSVFTIPMGRRSRWSSDERRVSKPSSTISIPHDRNDSRETSANELSRSGDSAISMQRLDGDIESRTRRSITRCAKRGMASCASDTLTETRTRVAGSARRHLENSAQAGLEHPFPELGEQAGVLGHRHELVRGQPSPFRVVPPDERLHRDGVPGRQLDRGLVLEQQLAFADGAPELAGQADAPVGVLPHGDVEQLDAAPPAGLCLVHRRVGLAEQRRSRRRRARSRRPRRCWRWRSTGPSRARRSAPIRLRDPLRPVEGLVRS